MFEVSLFLTVSSPCVSAPIPLLSSQDRRVSSLKGAKSYGSTGAPSEEWSIAEGEDGILTKEGIEEGVLDREELKAGVDGRDATSSYGGESAKI